jgi:hypothetical protein
MSETIMNGKRARELRRAARGMTKQHAPDSEQRAYMALKRAYKWATANPQRALDKARKLGIS